MDKLLQSRTLEDSDIEQEIDLGEYFGRKPTAQESRDFEIEALETIIGRTQSGKSVTGKKFPKYNEDYAEEKGVSPGAVDLTLFGDMLLAIDASTSGSMLTLKIDDTEAAKAHGNITGSYGRSSRDDSKARDFFGLSIKEVEQITSKVKRDNPNLELGLGALLEANRQEINIGEILANIGLFVD